MPGLGILIFVNIMHIFDYATVTAKQHFKFCFGSAYSLVRVWCTGCNHTAFKEGSDLVHACCRTECLASVSCKRI